MIGSSFKHARPRKEPLHGRMRLLGDPPASDEAWGGHPGLCSSSAEARARAPRAVTASFRRPDADSCAGQQFPTEVKASAAQGHRPPAHPTLKPGET